MNRWAPVPWEHIRQIDRARFDRDNPAPLDVLGYLLIWGDLVDGKVRSSRDLADHLGWTRHRARRIIGQAKTDHAIWLDPERDHKDLRDRSAHFPPITRPNPPKTRPPAPTIPATSETPPPQPDQNPPTARPSCARDLQVHIHTPTSTKCSIRVSEIWDRLCELRTKHLPGSRKMAMTPARQNQLRARIKEHGEDAVLEVWQWALTSRHKRAVYLRESGYVKPGTVHRPSNFADYLDLLRERSPDEPRTMTYDDQLTAYLNDDDAVFGEPIDVIRPNPEILREIRAARPTQK